MTSTEPQAAPSPDDGINVLDILTTLWAGKLWIAASVLLSLMLGAFLVLTADPTYRAEGLLQLEARAGALALPDGMQELLGAAGGGSKSPGEAEMEIIKSRMVMGEAVRELNLQVSVKARSLPLVGRMPARLGLAFLGRGPLSAFSFGDERIIVGELEVPTEWLGEVMVLEITGPEQFRIALPDERFLEGKVRTRLALADIGFSLMVDMLEGPVGRQFLLTRNALPVAVSRLQENFSIIETPRGSSILRVSYVDPAPRKAERILDAISQAYVSQNISRSAAEAQNSLKFIEDQLPLAEKAATDAQNALNAYRQSQQSVDVDYETRSLLERATDIETQLSQLALEEEKLKDRYTVNHPVYRALQQDRATLEKQLEELRGASTALPETQKEIFNLTRNLEVAQQVYVQLLNRRQELQVVQASTVGSVRIIDRAQASDIRIAPRTTRTMVLALFFGLVIGSAAVLVNRALRRGIRGAQEIEQSGLPVFATVNFSADAANMRHRKGTLPILALTQPDDLVIEALRSLRTSLHFGMLDAQTNSILLTSAAPGAGKTFTAVNLAVIAAQAGQKVCLIDADLRKGYLRRFFGIAKATPGLAEYLAMDRKLDEVLLDGPVPGLSVITSGRYPPNPSELLMRSEFERMLRVLDKSFDLVIVDSPPVLAVTDPVVIGRYVGARLLVVRHLETMLGEVEAVRRTFETAGSKITGAILNGYRVEEGSRYGGQYHYYNYRYTYRTEKSAKSDKSEDEAA